MTTWLQMANAVRDRFKTQITVGLSIPTQNDNEDFTPTEGAKWCRFTLQPGITDQLELGSPKTFRSSGRAVVSVFLPLATGDADALSLADSIASFFRSTTVAGITYFTPSLSHVGRSGEWWQTNIDIPFYTEATV